MKINNKIYVFQGEDKLFLKEKFESIDTNDVEIFVWQNADKSLGFSDEEKGISLLKSFIKDAYSILFPTIKPIEKECDIDKHVNNFKGVSFWGNEEIVKHKYEEYLLYIKNEKKNRLLKRHNKKLIKNHKPSILEWYVNGHYTKAFTSFVENNKLNYVIWSFSDFGIYFFHIQKDSFVLKKVQFLCNKENNGLIKISNMKEMPHY